MSDFSDRPFAAGSLVGLRAFKIDKWGRLTGPSHGGVFKPGENVGECVDGGAQAFSGIPDGSAVDFNVGGHGNVTLVLPDGSRHAYPSRRALMKDYPPKSHQVGTKGCSCGFYAYFDGGNDYHQSDDGTVAAVVEGYGTCTLGDRGFRAEKARLLALIVPEGPRLMWWDRNGPRVLAGVAALSIIGLILNLLPSPQWWAILSAVALPITCWSFVTHRRLVQKKLAARAQMDKRYALVRRNYADVPTFATTAEAIAAHPLTPPAPPSPDDDDFWTRSAR